ncbi:hypothetical protein GEMRC1_011308 [Eukaryota sp. GEM-RC1]
MPAPSFKLFKDPTQLLLLGFLLFIGSYFCYTMFTASPLLFSSFLCVLTLIAILRLCGLEVPVFLIGIAGFLIIVALVSRSLPTNSQSTVGIVVEKLESSQTILNSLDTDLRKLAVSPSLIQRLHSIQKSSQSLLQDIKAMDPGITLSIVNRDNNNVFLSLTPGDRPFLTLQLYTHQTFVYFPSNKTVMDPSSRRFLGLNADAVITLVSSSSAKSFIFVKNTIYMDGIETGIAKDGQHAGKFVRAVSGDRWVFRDLKGEVMRSIDIM